jgi:hypothetical protein
MVTSDVMKAGPYRTGIRVTPETLDLARSLVEYVSQHGWTSLDLPRKDPPSLTNVVEEALKLLEQRKRGGKKR